jgi:hypothetical protein
VALFRPSSLVQAVSGRVGGVVFVAGSQGSYIRRVGSKTIARPTALDYSRKAFGDGVSTWQNLTDAQRKGWNVLAARIYRTDRLGVQKPYSGRSLFLREAAIAARVHLPIVLDAPGAGVRISMASYSVAYTSTALTLSFVKTPGTPSGWIIVYGARSFSQTGFTSKQLTIINAQNFTGSATINVTFGFEYHFLRPDLGEYYAIGAITRFNGCLWSTRWETIQRRT